MNAWSSSSCRRARIRNRVWIGSSAVRRWDSSSVRTIAEMNGCGVSR
jgi:hypothetical protein